MSCQIPKLLSLRPMLSACLSRLSSFWVSLPHFFASLVSCQLAWYRWNRRQKLCRKVLGRFFSCRHRCRDCQLQPFSGLDLLIYQGVCQILCVVLLEKLDLGSFGRSFSWCSRFDLYSSLSCLFGGCFLVFVSGLIYLSSIWLVFAVLSSFMR